MFRKLSLSPVLCVNQLTRKSHSELIRYASYFILELFVLTFFKCFIHISFSLQLEDGDIVCFQKSLPVESTEQFRYPDVPSFLEYVHNRQVHSLRPLYLQFSCHWVYSIVFIAFSYQVLMDGKCEGWPVCHIAAFFMIAFPTFCLQWMMCLVDYSCFFLVQPNA